MPYQIVYTSTAARGFSIRDLAALLRHVRAKNERLGVTGMLLYREGVFLQVLEGERDTLEALYDTIQQDERHTGVLTVRGAPVEQREFGDWAMGFRDLRAGDMDELKRLDGFSDFFQSDGTARQLEEQDGSSSFAYDALLHFRRQ